MIDILLLAALVLGAIGSACAWWQRSLLYPAACFCFVWAGALIGLIVSGERFAPITAQTVAIYTGGAIAFAIGGLAAHPLVAGRAPPPSALSRPILYGMLLLLFAGLPLYLLRVRAMIEEAGVAGLFLSLRVQSLRAAEDPQATGIGIVGNLVPLSTIFALVAYRQLLTTRAERLAAVAIFLLALVYSALTGGRGSGMALALSLIALVGLRPGRLPKGTIALALLGFITIFVGLALLVRKGTADPNASWAANLRAVTENFQVYALGGVIAFDRVVDDPGALPSTGGVLRTAKEMANVLGARYEIPSLHAQFTTVGDGLQTNVYSMYMPYYQDVGLAGSLALVFVLGTITTFAYLRARAGGQDAMVLSAVFFAGLMQSVFNEPFYTNVNFLAKLSLFLLLLQLIEAVRTGTPAARVRDPRAVRVEA